MQAGKYSIKDKTLFLVAGALIFFALSAGALFVYNEKQYLDTLQHDDEQFAKFAYNQIFDRQKLQDQQTLEAFINTPGFKEAFVARDRQKVIALWNERWDAIKTQSINILQLHEANGRSFIRMHEQDHYGDMIVLKRPMIAHVHKTHKPVSAFEIGRYGLAYRVAVPVFINGKYEGALEIGSEPKRLIDDVNKAIDIAGFILIPNDPLLISGVYEKRIGKYWLDGDIGVSSDLFEIMDKTQFESDTIVMKDIFSRFAMTTIPLYNYQNKEISKAVFLRDNTAKAFSAYLKIISYGAGAFAIVLILLVLINRWLGSLIGQLEISNKDLSKAIKEIDRYKTVLDTHNIVSKSDLRGVITYVNDNFCKISGYSQEELIGKPHSIIRHPDTPPAVFQELWKKLLAKESWKGILKNQAKDGSAYYIDTLIVPFLDDEGEVSEYIAVRHDITELITAQENLKRQATTDSLTQLGNRLSLMDDLIYADHPSMALLDIDRFSEINDFYGQRIGDKVIVELSNLLRAMTHGRVKLYRLGADVFAILGEMIERQEFLSMAHQIASAIRAKPISIHHKPIPIETTIGISFESKSKLLSTCDMALTIGKKQKVPFVIYAEELSLEKEYADNISWALKIKDALEDNRIITHYQPIIDNTSGIINKYETLVRLIDEEGNIVSPFFFINIAKKSKQYPAITKRIIQRSFEQFANSSASFSINLTMEDILADDFCNYLGVMLEKYDVRGRLIIELVESEGIENFEQVVAFITKIKTNGVAVAIDDFGTGYSNFEYLLRLQPDFIKIDGSMIRHINTDAYALEVIKTIVDFAKRTNIKTIAEYVCDEEVYTAVKRLGIDYSQGYFIGEPHEHLLPSES